MYSLATQPPMTPTIRNNTVRNEPNTKPAANIFLPRGKLTFLPCFKGKFKVDSYFPI